MGHVACGHCSLEGLLRGQQRWHPTLRRGSQGLSEDIVGEVHADGEIICGAWYDTHLLMGGDWDQTLTLFVDRTRTSSHSGQKDKPTPTFCWMAPADDDDDDLSNGTPNAAFTRRV